MLSTSKHTGIGTFSLVMLITGAIDSIRNLPATALFGSSLIFFFTLSAIVFLIPAALVSAELAAAWPEKGGIYHWIRIAFGEKTGFLAVWLQWITNLVWFPTILSFIASTAAYLIDPALAQNKIYLVGVILFTFWGLTIINLKGIHLSAKIVSFCTVIGMIIPMTLIIVMSLVWLALGHTSQVQFTADTIFPSLNHTQNWMSLTAIMTAFLGMELAAVHITDVKNPQRTFPKALIISTIIILVTMILGSLSIAIVLPQKDINLVSGVMMAFTSFFAAYHISWIMPLIALMILLGTLGGIVSWVISPARGLLQAAQSGYLPKFFQQTNKHGVARNLLLVQAAIVSVVCLTFLLMPSVNGSFWLLTALSTEMYIVMYIIMFIAGIRMRYKFPQQKRPFLVPTLFGAWAVGLLGMFGCLITLIVGFFPPDGINVGSTLRYDIIFVAGMFAILLPVFAFYSYKNRSNKLNARIDSRLSDISTP